MPAFTAPTALPAQQFGGPHHDTAQETWSNKSSLGSSLKKICWVAAHWSWTEVPSVGPRPRLPAHLTEPVCHSLARNNGCINIFRGYCCQTWKLAHNYRLPSIAFPYFITNNSFSSSTTPNCNLPFLPEMKSLLSSPTVTDFNHLFLTLWSPVFFYLLCFTLLLNFTWTFSMK